MESRTKNRRTRDQIDRMALRAFGIGTASRDEAVVEMTDGWFNAAYGVRLSDGREVVLKIAPPAAAEVMDYERNLIATEVSAMRLVRSNPSIPVPDIHVFDDTRDLCDAAYFFMEKLKGESLERAKESLPPEGQARVRFQIGEIVRAINGFTGTYFGYPGNPRLRADDWKKAFFKIVDSVLADGLAKNVDYGTSREVIGSVLRKHAPALEEVNVPRLVHWDAWDSNFFVKEGRVSGLLDFERALWGDPLMEAQFRPVFGAFGQDILRGYGKAALTRDEERRSFLYMLHLGLVMVTECAYRDYDSEVVHKKGRALIARAVEWLEAY